MGGEAEQPRFSIEPLNPRHDRAGFTCGVDSLDAYFQRQAGQDVRKHAAVPFVLTPDGTVVAGYYTLSQYAIQFENIPQEVAKKLARYSMVPTTLIGRLAVSLAFRGRGLGEKLLVDALKRILAHSAELASSGVIVDAIDEAAASFYRKYGFLELPQVSRRLFLPMGTIKDFFE